MEERQLIKKIEQLREIKPRKEWVFLTKKELFGEEKSSQVLSWLFTPIFTPIRRPALAFAFRGVMVLVVVLAGAFFYLYYLNSQTSQISLPDSLASLFESQENKKIVASLDELQMSLKEINSSLYNLKNAKNPGQALVMTEVVKGTANRGKETVENIKNQSPSKKVSASLGDVGDAFGELGEVSYSIQKGMIEEALRDLENKTLSEENQERLEKAKEYYKEGKEIEAVFFIEKIYNK